jgi:hypothetical protein
MENNIAFITKITYLFFVYLVLAIFIERFVEICVSVLNYIDLKWKGYRLWNRKARKLQGKFERLYGYQGGSTPQIDKMLNWILWKVLVNKPYPGGKDMISASLIRLFTLRTIARILTFLTAIGLTLFIKFHLKVDLISIVKRLFTQSRLLDSLCQHPAVTIFLTAILVSLGSEPLHQIISRLEAAGGKISAEARGGTYGTT